MEHVVFVVFAPFGVEEKFADRIDAENRARYLANKTGIPVSFVRRATTAKWSAQPNGYIFPDEVENL